MRYSPHPPSPLLPHGEQGEPPQIRRPDAVGNPAPAQGAGFGVRAGAANVPNLMRMGAPLHAKRMAQSLCSPL